MSEFNEGVLKLCHAKELLVFRHMLKTNPLALFRFQTQGKVERLSLSGSGVVVFSVILSHEWRCDSPRHIDEL
jgi:hypothetical protein